MINHIWSLLCRRSVIDKDSNNISLFDVMEQISFNTNIQNKDRDKIKKINVPLEYEVVSFWTKPDGVEKVDTSLKLEILSPKGEVEKTFEQPLIIAEDKKRLRSRVLIKGFVVEDNGKYLFNVSYRENNKYTKVASLPFDVMVNRKYVEDIKMEEDRPQKS